MDSKFSSTAPMGAVGASALGVISKGSQGGGAPIAKIIDQFGVQSPQNSCISFAFQSV